MSSTRCLTYHPVPHYPNETQKVESNKFPQQVPTPPPTPPTLFRNDQFNPSSSTPISQTSNNSHAFNSPIPNTQTSSSDNKLLSSLASEWGIDFKKHKRSH